MPSRYDEDLVIWSEEQSRALRSAAASGRDAPIDWEHVAEEIESLGISERHALASRLRRIIEHLMKLEASPAEAPVRLWKDTIRRIRLDVEELLATSPSLRRELGAVITAQTNAVRKLVRSNLEDYGEQPRVDLDKLAYSEAQVLGDWMPPD